MTNLPKITVELAPLLDVVQTNNKKILVRRDGKATLPGQPRKTLHGDGLVPYLRQAHLTTELDQMAPRLFYVRQLRLRSIAWALV